MGIPLNSSFDRGAGVPLDSLAVVATIGARDSIVSGVRYDGMVVYVVDSDGLGNPQSYQLQSGITNFDWAIAGGGDTSLIEALIEELMESRTIMTTVDPTVTDDASEFINEGTFWYNITSGATFILVDDTIGAAVWAPVADPNAVTNAGTSTDNAIARFDGVTGKAVQDSLATIADDGTISATAFSAPSTSSTSSFSGVSINNNNVRTSGTDALSLTSGTSADQALALNGYTVFPKLLTKAVTDDSTTTGALAVLAAMPTTPYTRFTNASLVSVAQIPAPASGTGARELHFFNNTGNPIRFLFNTGGNVSDMILGEGSGVDVADGMMFSVSRNHTSTKWVAGSVSTAPQDPSILKIMDGSDISLWTKGNNATFLGAGSFAGSLVPETAAPIQGVQSYKYTQAAGSLNDWFASPAIPVDSVFRGKDLTIYLAENYNGGASDIQLMLWDATAGAALGSPVFAPISSTNGIMAATVYVPSTCASIRVGFHVKVLNSAKVLSFDSIVLTRDGTRYVNLRGKVSELRYEGASARGSTDTGIIKFDTQIKNTGDAFDVISNSTLGTYITMKKAGVLIVNTYVTPTVANQPFTVTKNQVTKTSIGSTSETFAITAAPAIGNSAALSGETSVIPGDVIRVSTTAVLGATSYNSLNLYFVEQDVTGVIEPENNPGSISEIMFTGGTVAPKNFISAMNKSIGATGADYNGSEYKALYDVLWAMAGLSTTAGDTYRISSAKGASADADWAANKRITIDYETNEVFVRGKGSARNLGSYQADAFQGHWHSIVGGGSGFTALGDNGLAAGATVISTGGAVNVVKDPMTMGSYGTPRTAVETRPKNTALNAWIRFSYRNYIVGTVGAGPIVARSINSAGTSYAIGSNTLVYDGVKTFDPYGAINTTTGVFTSPKSTYYTVKWAVLFAQAVWALGEDMYTDLQKNGVTYALGSYHETENTVTAQIGSIGSTDVYLAFGETLLVKVVHSRSGANTLIALGAANFFSISEVV